MQCKTFLRVMQISLPSIFYGKKKDRLYFTNYFKNISQNFFQFSIEEKKNNNSFKENSDRNERFSFSRIILKFSKRNIKLYKILGQHYKQKSGNRFAMTRREEIARERERDMIEFTIEFKSRKV